MSVILGATMGVFIGVSLYALVAVDQINSYKHKYQNEKLKVNQRDRLIYDIKKEQETLLLNAKKCRQSKRDFICKTESILYSNVHSDKQIISKIKELVNDYQSNN